MNTEFIPEEIEVTCPSCSGEFLIEEDEIDDEVTCEECGYEFYPSENF